MKGISPLIAAVLLIAFTLAIAGIMATWATTFTQEKSTALTSEAECIGALDVTDLIYDNDTKTVTLTIRNINKKLNLTNIKIAMLYSNVSLNYEYVLTHANVTVNPATANTSLGPTQRAWVSIVTTGITKPKSVEVTAENCPTYPVEVSFT
jgi:flagellin-like protein